MERDEKQMTFAMEPTNIQKGQAIHDTICSRGNWAQLMENWD